MTDILNEAFEELKHMGLVSSHNEFSVAWLNKSRRYMSMIRASDRKASLDAVGRLAANLKQRLEFYKTSKFGELREKSEVIYPLTRKVWTAFYEKALER